MKITYVDFSVAVKQSARALWRAVPLILSVILLVGLVQTFFPPQVISGVFHNNTIFDAFIGSTLGSVFMGSPITSYVIGGELLSSGVSIAAVTALIVSWVTVGIVQFPAETAMLGKRFAIIRNSTSFVLSIIVAVITSALLSFV